MRTAGALLLVVVGFCGLASSAGGRQAVPITLKVHQTVRLAGSNVLCGAGNAAGVTFVDCGVVDAAGNARKGSYVALLGQNGRVSVVSASNKIVFDRTAGLMQREADTVVHPGDTILAAGVRTILCTAAKVDGKPTVFCDRVDAKGRFAPGSYAFGISDIVVTALGWDAKRAAHLLHSWPENG
jgi:hypothetical protein